MSAAQTGVLCGRVLVLELALRVQGPHAAHPLSPHTWDTEQHRLCPALQDPTFTGRALSRGPG